MINTISNEFDSLKISAPNYDLDFFAYQYSWPRSSNLSHKPVIDAFLAHHKQMFETVWTWATFRDFKGSWEHLSQESFMHFLLTPFEAQEELTHFNSCPMYNQHVKNRINLLLTISTNLLDGPPTAFYNYTSEWGYELSSEVDGGFCVILINEKSCKAILIFADSVAG
jgi:hypothetical protein